MRMRLLDINSKIIIFPALINVYIYLCLTKVIKKHSAAPVGKLKTSLDSKKSINKSISTKKVTPSKKEKDEFENEYRNLAQRDAARVLKVNNIRLKKQSKSDTKIVLSASILNENQMPKISSDSEILFRELDEFEESTRATDSVRVKSISNRSKYISNQFDALAQLDSGDNSDVKYRIHLAPSMLPNIESLDPDL